MRPATVYLRYNKFDVENTPAGAIDTLDPLWRTTQTVPPTNVQVTQTGAGTATLMWTPIAYTAHGGYYEVLSSQTPGGNYTSRGTTAASGAKTATGLTVSGLPAGTNYFVVRTFTPAHTGVFPQGCTQEVDCVTENNPNDLTSANSAETSANVAPPLIVTKTADTDDNDCSASDCSLREAIAAANATSASESIEFNIPSNDAGCINGVCTITLGGNELSIANNGSLIINGTSANRLVVSGNNQSRVIFIQNGANATINELTIKDGIVNANCGGGIYVDASASFMLNSSFVTNNTATSGGSCSGGGGGIYNASNSGMTVVNSTISDNSAGTVGGGIRHNGSVVTLINSTVSNNSAGSAGGGIRNFGSTVNLTNTTFTGNSAPSGAGVLVNGGTYNVTNSIIANSTGPDCTSTGTLNINPVD